MVGFSLFEYWVSCQRIGIIATTLESMMKKFSRFFKVINYRLQVIYQKLLLLKLFRSFKHELQFETIIENRLDRNFTYEYFLFEYLKFAPDWLRNHREYFALEGRGFGEDPFHSAWLKVLAEFKPKNCLEIGVYRGQVISLWALIAKKLNIQCSIYGITPLNSNADSVSAYMELDYEKDINLNFAHFALPLPTIHKGLSTEASSIELIDSKQWDLIYIDGSHDLGVVLEDLKNSIRNLGSGGLLVLDDSSLYVDFHTKVGRPFRGHPGPSKAISEINYNEFEFLIGVGHNNFFRKK